MRKVGFIFGAMLCAGIANASIIYDSIYENGVYPLGSPDYLGENYECCHSNLGNAINFAGTDRQLGDVEILVDNWEYESEWADLIGTSDAYTTDGFYMPMTLNLYQNDNGSEGSFIGSQTINAFIPWRPEPDPEDCPADAPYYVNNPWQAPNGSCYDNSASTVVFSFGDLSVPDSLIYTLAFNTQDYGADPTGVAGPYNGVDFGITRFPLKVGTEDSPYTMISNDQPVQNWLPECAIDHTCGRYQIPGHWLPYTPEIQFNASTATPEPQTRVLMFCSLAALTFAVRRRRMPRRLPNGAGREEIALPACYSGRRKQSHRRS